MNDLTPPQPETKPAPKQSGDPNRLTAETFEDFVDALDILYIKGNLSGRLKFLEAWPLAAENVFGEELVGFDRDGTDDFERRSHLEDEAEERRLAMLELAQMLEEKSVEKSVLQVEYVEGLVKELGRDLALLFYAPKIVDRYIPPPPEPVVVEDAAAVDEVAVQDSQPEHQPIPEVVIQTLDVVQPVQSEPVAPVQQDVPDPYAAPAQPDFSEKPALPDYDESLDAIQPISIGGDSPEQAPPAQEESAQQVEPLPPETPAPQPTDQPPAPSDPVVQDVSKPSAHSALDDLQPVASQKMTFVPAKKEEQDTPQEKPSIPVIGDQSDDKPQDDGL